MRVYIILADRQCKICRRSELSMMKSLWLVYPGRGRSDCVTSSVIIPRIMFHRILRRTLSLVLSHLASLVVFEAVVDAGEVPIAVEDCKHLHQLGVRHLLIFLRIRHQLSLVLFDVSLLQLHVRHVLHVDTRHAKVLLL